MKVTALTSRCIASGSCALTCGQVFGQRESDGVVEIVQAHPSLSLLGKVQQAVLACPSGALVAEDEENQSELALTTSDEEI